MSENNEEKRKFNIEDFFTEDHERDGVWFEPKIKGVPCGIEFLVTGSGTDENMANAERYDKAMAELQDVKDLVEKAKKQKKVEADRVADFVQGIRPAKGCEPSFNGKPLEYSKPFIKEFLLRAPLIKIEIAKFATQTANFITREKND